MKGPLLHSAPAGATEATPSEHVAQGDFQAAAWRDGGARLEYPETDFADRPNTAVQWIGKALTLGFLGLRHWRSLWPLWTAPPGSPLHALVRARPEIWGTLRAPFIASHWKVDERFSSIVDHCHIVSAMGPPLNLRPNEFAVLTDLREIGPDFRVTIDQPRWMLRDGLLVLSLWEGDDRFYSLAFTFADSGNRRVAYIGGVQGRRGADLLGRYREFTKAAHGMRPRDLVIELFRVLCAQLGVAQLHGVSDVNRHQRSRYFTNRADFIDPVRINYDEMWSDRGGFSTGSGFYELPVRPATRDLQAVPARKRPQYRRRQMMLASLRERLIHVLADLRKIPIYEHEPIWL